jgi:hypothetical protein
MASLTKMTEKKRANRNAKLIKKRKTKMRRKHNAIAKKAAKKK